MIAARVVAYAAIGGLGYGVYQSLRQSQVQGALSAPGYELPPQIMLVRDFSDDLKSLHDEYQLARQPYLDELKNKQDTMKQVQSDLTGLEERERLLQQEINNARSEITTIIAKGQEDAQKVWQSNGNSMESEYNQKLQEFENKIKERATQLGLDYQYDPSIRSPEVWVNAFRLALYNPPKAVKTADERAWVEGELKEWTDYEKSQDDKRQALKAQVDTIHKTIAPKVAETDDRVSHLQARIASTEEEATPLRTELEAVTGQVADAKSLVDAETKKYFGQLYEIPTHNVLDKLPLEPEGRWEMTHLEQNPKYQPGGKYLMWITLKKDGQDYWALVPFSPVQDSLLKILISDKAFVRTGSLLE